MGITARWLLPLLSAAVLLGVSVTGRAAADEQHPRLFLTPERLAEIKQAIKVPGSTHAEAFAAMKQRVQAGPDVHGSTKYRFAYHATEAATVYLLTGDKRWADVAFHTLKQSTSGRAKLDGGYGLARAMMSKGFGYTYDFAYNGWNETQRQWVKDQIKRGLDRWPSYGHSQLGGNRASNWVGVCRGGELLAMLATYEDQKRPERYQKLKRELSRHITAAYSTESGWCNEGTSYLSYAGQFFIPAVLALRSVGDHDLDKELDARPFWKLIMFSRAFAAKGPAEVWKVSSGVDWTAVGDEGFSSILLGSTPEDKLPYYIWFYDRLYGNKSTHPIDKRYDSHRAGAMYALFYYPQDMQAQDPTGKLDHYLADEEKGVFYFRNRWKDADDVLFLGVSNNKNDGGWNLAEACQINLVSNGQIFFGGPGKDGVKVRHPEKYSKLLIDGKFANDRGGRSHFTPSPNGGYVVLDGGKCYEKVGVQLKRHVLVSMDKDPSEALMVTVDDVTANGEHTYTYNLALGEPNSDAGIRVSKTVEAGRPTFTMVNPQGGYCKGWVVAPAGVDLQTGDPTSATTRAAGTKIFVVMYTGKGTPPTARIDGDGMDSTIQIGGKTVQWDGEKITCE